MKRVVALLLIASVALFAAVAPQSDLKVNAGSPMEKLPQAKIIAEPLQIEDTNVRSLNNNMSKAPALAVDTNVVTVVYLEDFENGAPGWMQFDGTAPAANAEWHLLDFGDGDSLWWCADLTLEGYESNWYVALETPEVVLTPGDSTLSFYLDLNSEAPGGEDPPYDGWDGGNVQISNDGGETWTVLNPTVMPYNCTSLYAFGYIFNEPAPGWGGSHEGIVEVDLGAYIGETVSIRFVFGADGGYDTHDNAALYGMLVDSIDIAGDALYLGSVNDSLVSYSINEAQGTYWTVEDRVDSLPSPTHVLRNYMVGDTTYALNLEDYFVSPSITLPDEAATLIYCNFEFSPRFNDLDDFPNVEYWRLEVSPDNGTTWNAISNISGAASGSNYVYSDYSTNWFDFQYAYGEACDLTDLAGETVKFRFYFRSDADAQIGEGLLIDDFVVYTQPDLPVVQNVAAAMNVDDNVEITWQNMDGTYQLPKSLMSIDPADCGSYYGAAWTFDGNDSTLGYGVGEPYSANGKDFNFTSIEYAVRGDIAVDSLSLAIFGVDTSLHLLHWTDNFLPDTVRTIQSVDISSENVSWDGDYWVMMFWEADPSWPVFFMSTAGGAMKLYVPGEGFYNTPYSTPVGASGYGEVTYSGLEYNVYRRVTTETTMTLVNSSPLSTNTLVDDTADPLTEYEYYVVCTSDGFEGQLSDGAAIFVTPGDVEERKYDDGTSEAIFEAGQDTMVVIKITPTAYPAKLEAMRFYGLYAGDVFKMKIFKDEAGMPGDSWLLIEPPVTAIAGWNTFQIPDIMTVTPGRDGVVLRDGESVWVGVKGTTAGGYPAWLGTDMNSFSGKTTMQIPGGGWTSIATYLFGNPMIRGYFDTDIDTTAVTDIVPAKYELAQNYPNPFNPVTTIHFELKETGTTKVDIFDVTGRHVRTLLNGSVEAGAYDLRFDASAMSSGIYFYRLTSGSFTDIKKMSLIK
ncbi:MAG: T9SS type A sorting domain-containing protein [Candidatus Marinimicrobia bacterium]|nr:T9SS type A sorting domain-containing protein [Candidatus Neomarinimicrobiota bacterium]